MKQDSRNSISVIQRNLDEALQVNPIEDGNTPVNELNQGYIYTSELVTGTAFYERAYNAQVLGIYPLKTTTGKDTYFQISVRYTCYDQGVYAGWYGNNLIKAGDAFSIKNASSSPTSINWTKGSVISIKNVSFISPSPTKFEYTYDLLCSISEGVESLPQGYDISLGYYLLTFFTNRRVFTEKDDKAPINLLSSIRDGKVLFTWDDPTNKAVKYNFTYRSEDNSYDDGITNLYGNTYNFNGKVKTKLNQYGEVTTVKIVDPGMNMAWDTAIPNVITSTLGVSPPNITFFNNACGSLDITEYKIVDVSLLGPNTITCTVIPYGKLNQGGLLSDYTYVDLYQNTQLGEARVSTFITNMSDYLVVEIEYESSFTYSSLAAAQADLIGKIFKAHTGAYVSWAGNNMNKEPKLECDKYNENTKNVYDVTNFPGPGTYYWKVASIFDCNEKTYTEWSQEAKLIIP